MNPRDTLASLAREQGSSLAALSRMIGRNSSYLQQYITKGSPRKLEEEDRRTLAQFFGVDEAALGAPEGKSYISNRAEWIDVPRLAVDYLARFTFTRNYGTYFSFDEAAGGDFRGNPDLRNNYLFFPQRNQFYSAVSAAFPLSDALNMTLQAGFDAGEIYNTAGLSATISYTIF